MEKYQYTDDMEEISGFGGGYEKACRSMVVAGLEWLDAHPKAVVDYKEYKQIYGITANETPDCKLMQKAMLKVVPDCSGAMMQASMGHVTYVHKNGWDNYVTKMKEKQS